MNETEVWNRLVEFLETIGETIYCGCPPGATCYRFRNCTLFDGLRADAPDLIFSFGGAIVLCECKGTFKRMMAGEECDVDKITRVVSNARSGLYDEQFSANFGISNPSGVDFVGGLAYGGELSAHPSDAFHFLVRDDHGVYVSPSGSAPPPKP